MAKRNRRLGFVVVIVAVFTVSFLVNRRQKQAAETADLILVNGKIVTVDDRFPTASWIALRGDRIAALGSSPKGFNRHVGDGTEIVDLGGALAVPGLIESHGHFTGLGQSKTILDLTKARSWDDIVALVAEAAKSAKPGEWIQGRGWHQDKWDRVPEPSVEGLPFHDALSQVTPDNPVLLDPRQRPFLPGQRQGHGAVQDHRPDDQSRRAARSSGTPRAGPSAPSSRRPRAWSATRPGISRPRRPPRGPASSSSSPRRSASPTASRPSTTPGPPSARSTSTRRWPRRAPSPSASTSCSAPTARPWPRAARPTG